ncbi:MAG: FAD binding domain-containing protein [Burkholderiales bacterium]
MKPAAFDYLRAESVDEVVTALAQAGEDARVLAGGQSLMAMLNMRLTQPVQLIDISRLAELDYLKIVGDRLVIGAAATQASVEWRASLCQEVPLLKLVFPHISHFQIRNRGTVCGSIAHADPSAELPLCLVALGGEVVLRSQVGRRVVKAVDFFQGMLLTARRADEIIEEVRYPLNLEGWRYGFAEFAARHGDFAIVAVAVVMGPDEIRLAVGGVADRPVVKCLPRLGGLTLQTAINDFAWELEAQSDRQATAKFRRHLLRRLVDLVIQEAVKV